MKKTVRVVNVNLSGGIIGVLGDSPQSKLNKAAKAYSNDGWRVQQILPAAFPNLILLILRLILLLITLGLYTTREGYYLLLEKDEQN